MSDAAATSLLTTVMDAAASMASVEFIREMTASKKVLMGDLITAVCTATAAATGFNACITGGKAITP